MRRGQVLVWAFLSLALGGTVRADDGSSRGHPTFYRDVLPIFQNHCHNCHRPWGQNLGGMIAPMSLLSYEEARPWAKSMARLVRSRAMPPWHASPAQKGVFRNERTLSQGEIDTVSRWATSGALRGDPETAPDPVEFRTYDGWSIGEPDLFVTLPKPFFVEDEVEDLYVRFETQIPPGDLPGDRWIKAVEFRPSSSVVHHVVARPLGGIAPGYEPAVYPPGYGRLLRQGERVTFEMHYHKEPGPGTGDWDQTEVAVKFWPPGSEIRHVVQVEPLGVFDFRIPPGASDYSAQAAFTFERDALILSLNPHMHLRGKAARYVAIYRSGEREVLLEVPRYDFNWQTTYSFKEPKLVPARTRIELTLWWDNSAQNPANPDPGRTVTWGRPTTAEMGFGRIAYVDSRPVSILVGGSALPGGSQTQ